MLTETHTFTRIHLPTHTYRISPNWERANKTLQLWIDPDFFLNMQPYLRANEDSLQVQQLKEYLDRHTVTTDSENADSENADSKNADNEPPPERTHADMCEALSASMFPQQQRRRKGRLLPRTVRYVAAKFRRFTAG